MGLVLNPVGFRVGRIYTWADGWFVHHSTYPVFVHNVITLKTVVHFIFYNVLSSKKLNMQCLYSHLTFFLYDNKFYINLYMYDTTEHYYLDRLANWFCWGWFHKIRTQRFWSKKRVLDGDKRAQQLFLLLQVLGFGAFDTHRFVDISREMAPKDHYKILSLRERFGEYWFTKEETDFWKVPLHLLSHGYNDLAMQYFTNYFDNSHAHYSSGLASSPLRKLAYDGKLLALEKKYIKLSNNIIEQTRPVKNTVWRQRVLKIKKNKTSKLRARRFFSNPITHKPYSYSSDKQDHIIFKHLSKAYAFNDKQLSSLYRRCWRFYCQRLLWLRKALRKMKTRLNFYKSEYSKPHPRSPLMKNALLIQEVKNQLLRLRRFLFAISDPFTDTKAKLKQQYELAGLRGQDISKFRLISLKRLLNYRKNTLMRFKHVRTNKHHKVNSRYGYGRFFVRKRRTALESHYDFVEKQKQKNKGRRQFPNPHDLKSKTSRWTSKLNRNGLKSLGQWMRIHKYSEPRLNKRIFRLSKFFNVAHIAISNKLAKNQKLPDFDMHRIKSFKRIVYELFQVPYPPNRPLYINLVSNFDKTLERKRRRRQKFQPSPYYKADVERGRYYLFIDRMISRAFKNFKTAKLLVKMCMDIMKADYVFYKRLHWDALIEYYREDFDEAYNLKQKYPYLQREYSIAGFDQERNHDKSFIDAMYRFFEKKDKSAIVDLAKYYKKYCKDLLNPKLINDNKLLFQYHFEKRASYFESYNSLLFFLSYLNYFFKQFSFNLRLRPFDHLAIKQLLRFHKVWHVSRPILLMLSRLVEWVISYLSIDSRVRMFLIDNIHVPAAFIARFLGIALKRGYDYKDVILPLRKNLDSQMYTKRWSKLKIQNKRQNELRMQRNTIASFSSKKSAILSQAKLYNTVCNTFDKLYRRSNNFNMRSIWLQKRSVRLHNISLPRLRRRLAACKIKNVPLSYTFYKQNVRFIKLFNTITIANLAVKAHSTFNNNLMRAKFIFKLRKNKYNLPIKSAFVRMLIHLNLLKSNIKRMTSYNSYIKRCLRFPKKTKYLLKRNPINIDKLQASDQMKNIMLKLNSKGKVNFINKLKKDIGTLNIRPYVNKNIKKPNSNKPLVNHKSINERAK